VPIIDADADWVFTLNGRHSIQGFGKFIAGAECPIQKTVTGLRYAHSVVSTLKFSLSTTIFLLACGAGYALR
jgi:hypothetical protein